MKVKRIVANVAVSDPAAARRFYGDVLDLDVLMDMGWIVTYGSRVRAPVQISFMTEGGSGTPVPDLSVEVDDLDTDRSPTLGPRGGAELMPAPDDHPAADLSAREIVSARSFDAPRARVWEAFTDPSRLARWWGPHGFTSTFHAFDPRPGGVWRFTMHGPDGADYPNESVFVEVAKPERIVLRHVSAEHPYELTISLEEQGDSTRVTWRMVHETASACARVRPYVVAGNEQNFDRLAAELAPAASDVST